MKIAIIKYNAGNVHSIQHAIRRLGFDSVITDNDDELQQADKVIFPGVGNAFSAMESLKENGLDIIIPKLKNDVLGICVGMQLLCKHSEENDTTGLGIVDLNVKRFVSADPNNKVPHMGWNTIYNLTSPLLSGIAEESYVYYVHSYYVEAGSYTVGLTNYVLPFSSIIQKNNFYGIQFHAEKSASIGDKILHNFLTNLS